MEKTNWKLLQEVMEEGAFTALKEKNSEKAALYNTSVSDTTSLDYNKINEDNNESESYLPSNNRTYFKKEYWEERFATEDSYEWLVSYSDIAMQIKTYLVSASAKMSTIESNEQEYSTPKILVVGCGNSSFSSDLYDDGYTQIVNIDYSTAVIEKMRRKHSNIRPEMSWLVMDMTDMSAFSSQSFDVVIDKAAMDALMTEEKDPWNPSETVVCMARKMCTHISRILKPNGYHLHISFAQPHFRKLYLLGSHDACCNKSFPCVSNKEKNDDVDNFIKYDSSGCNDDDESRTMRSRDGLEYSKEFKWDHRFEAIGGENAGCFHHFLYIMRKLT